MIKMYVMHTCPDCEYVEKQVAGNPNFEVIDIGKHVRNLKQFIKLRGSSSSVTLIPLSMKQKPWMI